MQFWDQHKTITDYYELLAGRSLCQIRPDTDGV